MRKGAGIWALLLAALFLCPILSAGAVPLSSEAARCGDPQAIVHDELLPYLEAHPLAALLFAAELNLSNGPSDTRDYGERGMFGKLVNAEYVLAHYEALEPQADVILEEVRRLLFGELKNGGKTTFSFSERKDVRALDYGTGEWVKVKRATTIRIQHWTEYTGKARSVHLSFDPKEVECSYEAGFQILRK